MKISITIEDKGKVTRREFHLEEVTPPQSRLEAFQGTNAARLLELLDKTFPGAAKFTGTAPALLRELLEADYAAVESIARVPGEIGSLLAKIQKVYPSRISRKMLNGTTIWTVTK